MGSYSWNGGTGGWGTIANWTGGVPNSSTADATIAAGGTYTVTVEAGKTYTVDSVTLTDSTAALDVVGTLDLAGTLGLIDIASGTLELAGLIAGGTVDINGGTLEALGGSLKTVASVFLGGSSYIELDNHTLTLGGASTLMGYVTGPGELVISGQAALSDDTYFESGVTLDDTGTIALQSSNQFANGGTATTLLTIASGGIYDVAATNVALNNNGTFNIINAGTFEMTAPAGFVNVYYNNFVNTGSGTISVVGGSDITLLGSNATLAGHLSGGGELFLNAGTTSLQAGAVVAIGSLELGSNDTLILGSSFSLASEFDASTSSYLDLAADNLTLAGTGSERGYVYGGGTLDIAGSVDVGGLYLASGAEELVTGTAVQDAYSNRLDYDNGTAASILSIASTGTYDITAGNTDIDYNGARGTFINSGLFENTGTTGSYFNEEENFTQTGTGTLAVVAGQDISLIYGTDALSGTITGAGGIFIGNGVIATLEASLVLNPDFLTFSDSGSQIILAGSRTIGNVFSLQNGASLQLDGSTLTLDGSGGLEAYLVGPGALDVTGTFYQGLYITSGVTEVIYGAAIQNSTVELDDDEGTAASVISITSTGTYDVTVDAAIFNGYNNGNGSGTIINAGLFEKTGAVSYTNVYADFTNASTGTIFVTPGGDSTAFPPTTDISFLGATNSIAGTIKGGGDVYFGAGSADTLAATAVIGSLTYLTVSDSNTQFNIENSRTFTNALVDENGADVALNGNTLTLAGKTQFINASLSGNGELVITGTADINGLNVVGTATILDQGVITQDGYDELGTTNSAQVTLSIATHGTYDIIADDQINPQNGGPIINAGLFEKTAAKGVSDIYSVITNSSTGTIDAASGIMRLHSGGSLAGTIIGAGELDFDGNTFALAEASIGVANAYLYAGELLLKNNAADTHLFDQNGGTLALNGFNLSLGNPGDYAANGNLIGSGTLSESGRLDANNYYLSGGAVLKDTGTVTQDGVLYLGTFAADTAMLTIGTTGIYDILNDSNIGTNGATAVINNAGLFEKTAATGGSNIYAMFNNAVGAALGVANGYIQLYGGGTLAGALSGGGTLYLNQYYSAQTYTLAAAAVVTVATFDLNGAQLDLTGSRTITDTFVESAGNLDLGGFNLTLTAADSLDSSYLSGAGSLDVVSVTELKNYNVIGAATLLDAGTINQDGNLNLGNGASDSGTLSIAGGGTYNIVNDSYIYINGTGILNNAGLLEKTADNGLSYIQATINNTGMLEAARGTIQLASGGTLGGTLAGAGIIETTGGTFMLTSAAVVSVATFEVYSSTIDLLSNRTLADTFLEVPGGTVSLNSHTLTLTGPDLLQGYASGPGTVDVTGVTDLNGYNLTGGAVLLDAGTITQDGGLQIGESGFDTATLSIAATGTYDILNDNYVYEDGTVAVANAGLFEKTGSGTGRSYVQGAFTSSGKIAVTSGILEEQALTNDGTVSIVNATDQTDNGVTALAGSTGKFALGGHATLYELSGLAASQTVLLSGTSNVLDIGTGGSFAASVSSFAAGDTIDLLGTTANGYSYAANKLILTENGTAVSTISVATVAGAGTFSLVQDPGGNGTDILLATPGSITEPGSITTDVFTVSSGDFNVAANWSSGTVPGATNVAQDFNAGTVTDSGNNTVYQMNFGNGGANFSQTGGVLKVIDGGQIVSGAQVGTLTQAAGATIIDEAGTLSLGEEGTIAGTLTGAGSVELGANPGSGLTALTIAAGAVLSVATLALDNVVLGGNQNYAGVFAGPGGDYLGLNGFTLNLTGQSYLAPTYEYSVAGAGELILAGNAQSALLYTSGGSVGLTVAVTGTFTDDQAIYLGSGGDDNSELTIAAGGTLDLAANSSIIGDYNNAGIVRLVNAGLLDKLNDNGSDEITNASVTQTSTGVIDASEGTIVIVSDLGTLAGTLEGNLINLESDQMTIAAGAVLNVATLQINGGATLSLGGATTYAGNFDMSGGGGGTLALGGFGLDLTGVAELDGEYVAGSGTLTVAGSADVNGMELVGSETLLDATTITQDGGLSLDQAVTDTTSLRIGAGAVYDIINDSNIGANGTAAITNAGLFEKTADNGISYIVPTFTNASTGTIDVLSGTIDLQSGGTLAGTIEGAGELELQNNNGTFILAATAVLTVATLNVNEVLVLEHAETFTGDLIQTNNVDLNGFNLSLAGTASLDSSVQGNGTLTVAGKADISGLYLYDDAAMVVKGTVTQDGGFTMSNTGTDNTVLSIASGAVFDLLTDNSINANGPAKIVNAGLFEKSGDYGTSYIYPSFNSTGTIDVVRGFLDFANGGSLSGTIEGSKDGTIADGGIILSGGTLTLAATATVSVAEISVTGGDLSFGGNLNYTGSLSDTGGSLSLGGHTIGVTGPSLGGFYLTGPGTLDVGGTATLNGLGEVSGAHLVDKGTIIQDGGFQIGYSATDASQLSIISGATFDIITDNYIYANGTVGVVNAGLFEKTADNGYSGIQPGFTNQSTGVVSVAFGTLAFQGGGTVLGGTLKGAGQIQIDDNATLTSSVVTVATLDIANDPTLGSNLTYGGFFELNSGDELTLGSHALLLTGTAALVGGFEGPGSVTVSGRAYVQTTDLFGGATLVDKGFINQIDELRFGLNDGSSDTLSVASTGTYDIQDDTNFHSFGNAGSAEVVINAGLLEKTGDTGLSELQVTLSNSGTLLVSSGTLQVDAISNLAGGTLAGGTYVLDAGLLGPTLALAGAPIVVDAAAITLAGIGTELIAGGTLIEQSLGSVAASSVLAVLNGRDFTANGTIGDAGTITLGGGTFATAGLNVAAGATFAGRGVLSGAVTNNGLIDVTGTTLTIGSAVAGSGNLLICAGDELILAAGAASGEAITFGGSHSVLGMDVPASVLGELVSLAPSDTIDLIGIGASSATIAGGDLVITLTSGGTLSYALASANKADKVATHADGSGGTDVTVFRQATAGAIAPASVNFGEHHANTSLVQTYTVANTTVVDPYSERLDGQMGATSTGVKDSGSFTGLAPGATNSSALKATLVTSSGGLISGTAMVNLETDGNGVFGDSGTMALPPETVTLTGTIFNYATAAVSTLASLGQQHVGTALTGNLTLGNKAVAGSYSENLDATFSGTSSNLIAAGSISGLAAGATNGSALSLSLSGTAAGVVTGTTTLALSSDGQGIDTLGTTALAAAKIKAAGTLFNYATASTAAPVNLGIVHVGGTVSHYITISNAAAGGIYSENLDASLSGTTGPFSSKGTLSELAAGKTSTASLDVILQSGTAGTFSGTTTIGLVSDGKGIDTLGTTGLGSETVALTGTVNNYATAGLETISGPGVLTGSGNSYHLNLGSVAKGSAAVTENLGILNSATGPADNLSGTFVISGSKSIATSGFTTFSGVGAGQVDSAPMLTLNTGTTGTFTETIYIEGTGSNASGYSGTLAHETLIVTGTVTSGAAVMAGPATDTTQIAAGTMVSPAMSFVAAAAKPAAPTAVAITGRAAAATLPAFDAATAHAALPAWMTQAEAKATASGFVAPGWVHGLMPETGSALSALIDQARLAPHHDGAAPHL